MTRRLTTRQWAERRKDRKTKPCITRGCKRPGTRHGLCRVCYRLYPYECYVAGAEPTASKVRSDGYIDIQVEGLWCLEHRAIIMREMGRLLETREIVVHLDGNRSNNSRANLEMINRTELRRRNDGRAE